MLKRPKDFSNKITKWVGSVNSIILHTLFFIGMFSLHFFGISSETILLVLTTIVSLEAIYLAIFIQMTVNKHSEDLVEVSEDIEEIQEDVGEIQEDVEEISEDVGELQEDVGEIQEDVGELQEDLEEISEEEKEVTKTSQEDRTARFERIEKTLQTLLQEITDLKKK